MNKIDILLNAIALQHLRVEVVLPVDKYSAEDKASYNHRLYTALLCAFTNGVQHAKSLSDNSPNLLLKKVDIDLNEVGRKRSPEEIPAA